MRVCVSYSSEKTDNSKSALYVIFQKKWYMSSSTAFVLLWFSLMTLFFFPEIPRKWLGVSLATGHLQWTKCRCSGTSTSGLLLTLTTYRYWRTPRSMHVGSYGPSWKGANDTLTPWKCLSLRSASRWSSSSGARYLLAIGIYQLTSGASSNVRRMRDWNYVSVVGESYVICMRNSWGNLGWRELPANAGQRS